MLLAFIIAVVLVYLISTYSVYKYTQTSYSVGGIYDLLYPNIIDVLFMIIPVANTVTMIVNWFISPMEDCDSIEPILVKFFRIKK